MKLITKRFNCGSQVNVLENDWYLRITADNKDCFFPLQCHSSPSFKIKL